jgi:hypothetical protein
VDRWENRPEARFLGGDGRETARVWWEKINEEVFVSPPAVSPKEARFWLLANADLGLSKAYVPPEHKVKRRQPRTPTEKQCRTPLSASAIVKAVVENCPYPPPVCHVLFNLLPVREVVSILSRRSPDAGFRDRPPELPPSLNHLAGQVLVYAIPYLSDAEIEELTEQVRQALPRAKPRSEVWELAAYLGLASELQEYVEARKPPDYISHHIVFNLADARQVAHQARRLKIFLRDYDDMVSAWLIRTGLTALDHLRDSILQQQTKAAAARMVADLCRLTAPEMAPTVLELKLSSRAPAPATAWLEQHPAAVERVRREVLEHADKVLSPFDQATTPRWLGALSAPVAPARGAKAAPPSDWLRLGSLPDVQVGEHRLNQTQVEALLAELQASDLGRPRPLVSAVRQHVSGPVRDAFAWALFECWLEGGAPLSDAWGLLALGLLGGDGVALKLAPLVRAWPRENQHKRAATGLECLRALGTDTALRQLHGIAQTTKFKGLRARARECLEAFAAKRHLTPEQLEERLSAEGESTTPAC